MSVFSARILTDEQRLKIAIHDPLNIEEDSPFLKALSCIPWIGFVPSLIQETSLMFRIQQTRVLPHLYRLINLKNEYKAASAFRSLLEAVLIVVLATLHIFTPPFGKTLCAAGHLVLAALYIQMAVYNEETVDRLLSPEYNGEPLTVY